MTDRRETVNVRISTAVRPNWIIFTNHNFIVGMMTLEEWRAGADAPKEWDLLHISDHNKQFADAVREYGVRSR